MDPSNPNGILLQINVLEVFGNETVVTRLDIKQAQTSFMLWQTNSFPCHKSILISVGISCP
jgi:hypothetical protein